MEDMKFSKGEKVVYTDASGVTFSGCVEANSRGWVMIKLDEPRDTQRGWQASMMMVKSGGVTLAASQ